MYGFWRLGTSPAPSTRARLRGERARDGDEHEAEEGRDAADHGHDPDDQVARAACRLSSDGERAVAGEHEQPEEQRALLAAPERASASRASAGRGSCARRRRRSVKSWRTSAADRARPTRSTVEPKQAISALRAESASRRCRRERRGGAGDERVERQPEADDERCAAEVSHRPSGRSGRVYLLGHFVVSAVATNDAALELPGEVDVAADLEEVGHRAAVDDRDDRALRR